MICIGVWLHFDWSVQIQSGYPPQFLRLVQTWSLLALKNKDGINHDSRPMGDVMVVDGVH